MSTETMDSGTLAGLLRAPGALPDGRAAARVYRLRVESLWLLLSVGAAETETLTAAAAAMEGKR
jgi:hypothetical protein